MNESPFGSRPNVKELFPDLTKLRQPPLLTRRSRQIDLWIKAPEMLFPAHKPILDFGSWGWESKGREYDNKIPDPPHPLPRRIRIRTELVDIHGSGGRRDNEGDLYT
jgi:hypothetical protein